MKMEELEFFSIDIEEIINNVKEQLKEIDVFEIIHYEFSDDELILNIRCTFYINNTYHTHSFNLSLRNSAEKIIDHIKRFLKRTHNYDIDEELRRITILKNNINSLKKL